MVLRNSPGLDITMAPGGSAGDAGLHGPGGSVDLGHQYGLRCLAGPCSFIQPSVVTEVTDPGCCRVTDADMAPGSSPGPGCLPGQQAPTSTHSSSPSFLQIRPLPQQRNHSASLSLQLPQQILAHHHTGRLLDALRA